MASMDTLKAHVLLFAVYLFARPALSQTITLKAVNGKSGKPLPNQRLLVFAGGDAKEVRLQKHFYDLKTDALGVATLVVDDETIKRIQVWVDFQHLCQSIPNSQSFGLDEIASTGLQTPNDCGSATESRTPGLLVIYARPRTPREIRDQ
jgi:hypothetical protein